MPWYPLSRCSRTTVCNDPTSSGPTSSVSTRSAGRLRRISPATLVPASFAASGVLFLVEWFFRSSLPLGTAVAVYLHISGAGPILASGFWLIASERFDPHTAKKRFGHIAAAGTLGGLLSALITERIAALFGVPAMLPLLAVLQFGHVETLTGLVTGVLITPGC